MAGLLMSGVNKLLKPGVFNDEMSLPKKSGQCSSSDECDERCVGHLRNEMSMNLLERKIRSESTPLKQTKKAIRSQNIQVGECYLLRALSKKTQSQWENSESDNGFYCIRCKSQMDRMAKRAVTDWIFNTILLTFSFITCGCCFYLWPQIVQCFDKKQESISFFGYLFR